MSATGWSYFVPYQADFDEALQGLRQRVFEEEQYRDPVTGEDHRSLFDTLSLSPETRRRLEETMHAEGKDKVARFASKPATIDALLEQAEEAGTHSILDMQSVGEMADFAVIVPVSAATLREIFGIERPTRRMIEDAERRGAIEHGRRWEGVCLVAYENDAPHEIYFTGSSGD